MEPNTCSDMTSSGLVNGGVFCHDMGDIVAHGIGVATTVDFTILNSDKEVLSEFQEQYYPDASGDIRISGLDEVMSVYLHDSKVADLFSPDSNYKDIGGPLTMQMSFRMQGVYNRPGDGSLITQDFYPATARTGLFPSEYKYFLSRFRERDVFTDQLLTCAYIFRGQVLMCGIAWQDDDGKTCYKEIELTVSGMADGHICMHQYKPSDIANRTGVAAEQLLYVTFMLMDGSTRIDYMKMTFDNRKHPERTGFVFKNLFGVLEHLVFTGKNKHTADLEGTFSWIGRKYRKMHTDLTSSHTICTGWIDKDTHNSVKDAIRSEDVYMVNDLKLGDMVTITGIDIEYEKPSDRPVSAAITYRVSDKIQECFTRARQLGTRVFDDTFDKTFE